MTRPIRHPPRTHWALLSALLAALLIGLFLAGLIGGQVGESAQSPDSRASAGTPPKPILDGGPVVDSTRPDQPGLSVPDRRIALTFDDGPTPWTADILDVLSKHRVPATFFVVGARAADQPDLMRRMYQEGHEVGVHTFSHVNLANVSSWRRRLELDQTQLVIAAATGHTTNLLRAPYSSQVANLTSSEWQAVQGAGNYRAVYTDLDTRDWARPGIDAIVQGGTPAGDRGAVVMMHDGGGDRSQTVAALDALITQLQQRGYEFTTVSSAVGLNPSWQQATPTQQLQGRLMSGVVRAAHPHCHVGQGGLHRARRARGIADAGAAGTGPPTFTPTGSRRDGHRRAARGVGGRTRVQRVVGDRGQRQISGGQHLPGRAGDHRRR